MTTTDLIATSLREEIMKKTQKIAAALLLALFMQGAAADALTGRAQQLLDQGNAAEAFKLLEAAENERADTPDFDLLFGIAAIEVGQNTRAVFALERVLQRQPDHARARAELARAYLALGEAKNARTEFENVRKQDIPGPVAETIERFLEAVERLENVTQTTWRGYVETALGYDDNINVGATRQTIAIPVFGGLPFMLSRSSRASDAWFGNLGAGLSVRSPLNRDVALVGGLSGNFRRHSGGSEITRFDNATADANVGLVMRSDKSVYSLNAQINHYQLDDDAYRTAKGLSGQWQYDLDMRNQFSVYAQYSDLHYQTQRFRDADRWVLGAAYAHAFQGGQVVYGGGYLVKESAEKNSARALGFDGYGLRFGGQMNFSARTVLFASASAEKRKHRSSDLWFLKKRDDTQYDVILGLTYTPIRHWQITPKITWSDNDSNIDLHAYQRKTASLNLRYDF